MSELAMLQERIQRLEQKLAEIYRAGDGLVVNPGMTRIGSILTVNGVARASDPVAASDLVTLSYLQAHSGGVTNGDSHDHNGGDGGTIDHRILSFVGVNTHATIDAFMSSKAAANGLASLSATSKVVEDPANATATPTAGKIPIADGSGKLDGWITPGGYTFIGTLASDKPTAANTTPVVITDLVFSYAANSKYIIRVFALVAPAAATTGCGFQFDLSSVVTRIAALFHHQLANTGTLSGGHSVADNVSVGVSSGMPGTSSYPVVLDAVLVTGANTGTCQLMFRSETTAVTTCKAGTLMIVEKIA